MANPALKAQLNLGDWLRQYAKEKFQLAKRGEDVRTQVTVMLHRRFRGASLSDRIGRFIPGGTGLWRGDLEGDLDGIELKCVNIVKPGVKMAMSALASAGVTVNNEAANKQPSLRGAANVADGVCAYLDGHPEHWSDDLEARYCQMIQTGYGAFVRTRHNPGKKCQAIEMQEWEDAEETMPGQYACAHCGGGGPFDQMGEEDQVQCPECGQMAEVINEPEQANIPVPGQKSQFHPGDSETSISSCLEHRVDERNSQGGSLDRACWFEHHYLVTEEELAAEFPDFNFGADHADWSYPIKWKWALETGDDIFSYNYQSDEFRRRRERRDIYVLPAEYNHRVEPEDWELKDGKGKVIFAVKRGDRLADVAPDGFCFSLVGEQLAPYWREVDFRHEWAYGCFIPDAHSFWGQPLVELIQLQDDWNTLYTIDLQHRERNSLNQLTYYRDAFDQDDWNHDLVPSAEGWTLPEGRRMEDYWSQIKATPMSEAVTGLQFLFQILPYVGGAPPEAIGADPPGPQKDNYSAQLLRKQSMLGQLAPAGTSKANCKVRVFRNHMRIAQQTWPEERFEYLRTRFGEEWKDDDIQAFLKCNIDRDIITEYAEGSEVPSSLVDRVLKIEAAITRYLEAQMPPPEELVRQWYDLNNIDFDAGQVEADERLADARYNTIKTGLAQLKDLLSPEPTVSIDPMSGMPVQGPSELIQAVMSHPQLRVLPKESHGVAIKFYVSRETALMAHDEPDLPLVDCLEEMIRRHEAKGVEDAQTQNAMGVAAQAPMMQAQQQMAAAQQPAQPDPQAEAQAQAQVDAQQQQADAQMQQQQQQAEAQTQQQQMAAQAQEAEAQRNFEAADREAQRQHELNKLQQEHAHQATLKQVETVSRERMAMHQAAQKAKLEKAKPKTSKAA